MHVSVTRCSTRDFMSVSFSPRCSLQDFFMEFSRQRACILSRSALQLLYLSPSPATTASMAQSAMNAPPASPRPPHAFREILRESVRSFVNPPALTPKSPMLATPQVRFSLNPCNTLQVVWWLGGRD